MFSKSYLHNLESFKTAIVISKSLKSKRILVAGIWNLAKQCPPQINSIRITGECVRNTKSQVPFPRPRPTVSESVCAQDPG